MQILVGHVRAIRLEKQMNDDEKNKIEMKCLLEV